MCVFFISLFFNSRTFLTPYFLEEQKPTVQVDAEVHNYYLAAIIICGSSRETRMLTHSGIFIQKTNLLMQQWKS